MSASVAAVLFPASWHSVCVWRLHFHVSSLHVLHEDCWPSHDKLLETIYLSCHFLLFFSVITFPCHPLRFLRNPFRCTFRKEDRVELAQQSVCSAGFYSSFILFSTCHRCSKATYTCWRINLVTTAAAICGSLRNEVQQYSRGPIADQALIS